MKFENLQPVSVQLDPIAKVRSRPDNYRALSVLLNGGFVVETRRNNHSELEWLERDPVEFKFPEGLSCWYPCGVTELSDGNFALASARTEPPSRNAFFFDSHGRFLFDRFIGDGINHFQASPTGGFWVGYFDEGVFGCDEDDPFGPQGLVHFDNEGHPTFRYSTDGKPKYHIDDLYAQNVDDRGRVWICPYRSFDLTLVENGSVTHLLPHVPVAGANAIAVDEEGDLFALFGMYDHRNRLTLFSLKSGRLRLADLFGGAGNPLDAAGYGRGDRLSWLLDGGVYQLTLKEIMARLGPWTDENCSTIDEALAFQSAEAAKKPAYVIRIVSPEDK